MYRSYKLETSWNDFVNRDDLFDFLCVEWNKSEELQDGPDESRLLAPIGSQEIWAAGVTYYSSRLARMEESKDAGAEIFTVGCMLPTALRFSLKRRLLVP